LAPDRIYLSDPHAIAETVGEVVMHVDGHERRWQVLVKANDEASRVITTRRA